MCIEHKSKNRITKATQIITQPPTKDGDELGSDTRRGSSAYKNKDIKQSIYIYKDDYIYITR